MGIDRSSALGTVLRGLRESAGLSQEELAERAGLSPHAISALERGTRAVLEDDVDPAGSLRVVHQPGRLHLGASEEYVDHRLVGLDPLTGGQQHVEFAHRRRRRDLLGEVEQLVGGVTHRRDDHDDVVARLLGLDDPLGHPANPLGVRHRGSAVLLYDERHWRTFRDTGEIP